MSLLNIKGEELEKTLSNLFGNNDQLIALVQQAFTQKENAIPSDQVPNVKMQESWKIVSNLKELQARIAEAKKDGKKLRVVGANHSAPDAIGDQLQEGNKNVLMIVLSGDYRKMTLVDDKGDPIVTSKTEANKTETKTSQTGTKQNVDPHIFVKVGGGCSLGINPDDIVTGKDKSSISTSFNYQIDSWGYALPDLGGITQQTVGGFMLTGSAGGSITYAFSEAIEMIEFVDGTGTVQHAKRGTDLWKAVGVSMGLFGVVTNITFKVSKRFLVQGIEKNEKFADSTIGPQGKPVKDPTKQTYKLQKSIEEKEYYRALWFPQVDRVQTWECSRVPHKEFFANINSYVNELATKPDEAMLGLRLIDFLLNLEKNTIPFKDLELILDCVLDIIVRYIFKIFVPLGDEGESHYCDLWWKALPTDDKVPVDTTMKMVFTEVWMPIDQSDEVMRRLTKMLGGQDGWKKASNTPIEFYGAKKSDFWLSMSNQGNMVRVDPFWYANNIDDAQHKNRTAYFANFWNALMDIKGICFHWGKFLPEVGETYGRTKYDSKKIMEAFNKSNLIKWNVLRSKHDPQDVFLTEYWKAQLGDIIKLDSKK
eukprot:TCONS_00022453-protein